MSITNTITSITPIIRSLIKDQARTDGRDAFEFDSDYNFTLSESFVNEDSLQVFVNGSLLDENDWSYDSDTNQVEISFSSSGEDLNAADIVVITYGFYKKFSDTEIKNYLVSALTYFAEFRYHKIFEVDSSERIVAFNDLKPTINELYFIAIITSISIDPQNVDIDVDGAFRITATRDKTDQEQIAEAFTQFTRMIGSVSFESWRRFDNRNCC